MTNNFPRPRITRRKALVLTSAFGLSACTDVSRSPFLSTIANFRRPTTPPIDPKKVSELPYASMKAWFSGRARALLILGEYLPQQRLAWYSAEQQSVTTWGPFVVRLLGLDVNVRETALSGGWNTDLRVLIDKTLEKSVTFEANRRLVIMEGRSTFRDGGLVKADLLSGERPLRKIEEHILANGAHRFTNIYWIDEQTGFCWKSRQLVVPTMPVFNIEIIKAPRGA